MYKNLLLRNADKLLYPRFAAFAIIACGIIYFSIRQSAHTPAGNLLLMLVFTALVLITGSAFKSMSVTDPDPATADEEDDACEKGDRGTPTEDADLPVAEGGVA
ncbi:hypothetical protein [Mucilaginibacter celer]|uniref:Uncharacterized protein n=1 Tax=Mucilaginibacter celer TaxID=2305508 RepID=A0A494VRT5_9SPHI|nr:hypothetical protein [Mucilaginibacter celer]AYL97634.1 hypothetical protein HYN43_021095 [Mucilaginibacter celer]